MDKLKAFRAAQAQENWRSERRPAQHAMAKITAGQRRMVQRHHLGHRITSDLRQALRQPLQLTSPQATGGMTAPMAVEHEQTHTAHQLSRCGGAEPPQNRIEQKRMVGLPGPGQQDSSRAAESHPHADIAIPAPVLTEVTGHHQAIGLQQRHLVKSAMPHRRASDVPGRYPLPPDADR